MDSVTRFLGRLLRVSDYFTDWLTCGVPGRVLLALAVLLSIPLLILVDAKRDIKARKALQASYEDGPVFTDDQALERAGSWWKAKSRPLGPFKCEGLARRASLPNESRVLYQVGYVDDGGVTIFGEGFSWDAAFVEAVNYGFPPFCCEGRVDWDRLNRYLASLGKPAYRKVNLP